MPTVNGKNGGAKEEKKKLTPNEIVRAAYNYLSSVIGQTQRISDVRIEQLEPMEGSVGFWKVVLSYDAIGDLPFDKKREYKEFKINSSTGDVSYMKIFERPKV